LSRIFTVMPEARTPNPDSSAPVDVRWSDGAVTVRDARAFGPGGGALAHLFLRRVFALPEVRSVRLDRAEGAAVVRFDAGAGGFAGRLAAAVRGATGPLAPEAVPRPDGHAGVTVTRHGAVLTTWEVVHDGPGRLRLRNRAVRRDPALAWRVEAALGDLPGVREARVGRWSATLLVRYDPAEVSAADLIRRAERALDPEPTDADPDPGPPVRFGLANATLGAAALGELVVPALVPVSAVLVVGSNASTIRDAAGQLQRGKFGPAVVYTAIVGSALASGQFVACALMGWMVKHWQRMGREDLARQRRQLVEACGPPHAPPRLAPGDVVTVAAGEVVPADGRVVHGTEVVDERGLAWGEGLVSRAPGDHVQAGARVLTGQIQVAVERAGGATRAAAVGRLLEAATRPSLARTGPDLRAGPLACKAVGPTLATAGVGFLVGNLATAAAILAPDYGTGPGLAEPLGVLRDLTDALRRGLLVRDPTALRRATEVDVVVLNDHPALRRHGLELATVQTPLPETDDLFRYAAGAARHLADDRAAALAAACRGRGLPMLRLDAEEVGAGVTVRHGRRTVRVFDLPPNGDPAAPLAVAIDGTVAGTFRFRRARGPEAAGAVARFRELAGAPVVLLSDRPEHDASGLARALAVDRHAAGLSADDKARFLDDCRRRGVRTAWVGDARDAARPAAACHLAVAFAGDGATDLESSPAGVLLLTPRLAPLSDLWGIARAHTERLRAAERMTLGPNLVCVAGAFAFGFSSLTAVLISNLGTLGVYARSAGPLPDPRSPGRPAWRES
jgi:cation transport ATPase